MTQEQARVLAKTRARMRMQSQDSALTGGGEAFPTPSDRAGLLKENPYKPPTFMDRAGAAFKLTPQSQANYYNEVRPEMETSVQRNGELMMRDPVTGMQDNVDPDSVELNDVADLAPDAFITAATLGTGSIFGQAGKEGLKALMKVGARAGGMSAANQGAGAFIPGEETATLGQRAGRVATDVGATMAGETLGSGALSLANRFRPKNVASTAANTVLARESSFQTPFAREGQQVAQDIGVDLTPGAVTGQKQLIAAENMARQSIFSRDAAFSADQKIGGQFVNYVEGLIGRVKSGSVSAESAGTSIRDSYKNITAKFAKNRNLRGNQEYGEVSRLAGGDVGMDMVNTRSAIAEIKAKYSGIETPEARTIMGEMTRIEKMLAAKNPPSPIILPAGGPPSPATFQAVPLSKAQQVRSYFGAASAGEGNIFKDLAMAGRSKSVSARIFGAMNKDFDSVPGNLPKNASDAFKAANANWRKYSQQIEAIEKAPLAKMVGEEVTDTLLGGGSRNVIAPEKIAEAFIRLKPSEIGTIRKILTAQNPEAWDSARAYVLQNALEKSGQTPVSAGARTIPMNPSKFVNSLPKDDALRQMFKPDELRAISNVQNGLSRWADSAGFNFSGTGPYTEAVGAWQALKGAVQNAGAAVVAGGGLGTAAGGVVGAIGGASHTLLTQRAMMQGIAHAMATPRGRTMLMELTRVNPTTRRGTELLGAFTALFVAPNQVGDESVNQPQAEAN